MDESYPNILVVDDEPFNLEILIEYLDNEWCHRVGDTGESA